MTAVAGLLAVFVILGTCIQYSSAGCAGEIYDCREKRLCASTPCGQGLVCRVDNCKGCFAKCEAPGTVHIMSMPSAGPVSGRSSTPVTTEAGCPCPRNYSPVCATDGKRYDNICLAECAKATVTSQVPDSSGNCPKATTAKPAQPPPQQQQPQQQPQQPVQRPQGFTCRCAASYSPICGTDGKFYDNECFAICEGVKVSSVKPDLNKKACNMGSAGKNNLMQTPTAALPGTPTPPATNTTTTPAPPTTTGCRCPRILDPVCGADGKAYNNKCLAECAGVGVTNLRPVNQRCPQASTTSQNTPKPQQGPAPAPASRPAGPSCACPRNFVPVCGSDGKVYNNQCLAECAGVSVTSQKPEQCKQTPTAQPSRACACPYMLMPVCGADGKVYSNECQAKCVGVASTGVRPGPNNQCPGVKAL